jgi:hypothetical protein
MTKRLGEPFHQYKFKEDVSRPFKTTMTVQREGIAGCGVVYFKIEKNDGTVHHYPFDAKRVDELEFLQALLGAYIADFKRETPVTMVGENKAEATLNKIRELLKNIA